MKKPILVIMAAGLGSRYGGLKQIAPVDKSGHILMDYAVYDAKRAGFETIVCVLKPEMEKDFRELYGSRMEQGIKLCIATQDITDIPKGFTIPEGRVKPWGTAHALLCAKEFIDGPFAVINADDFYGAEAFKKLYDFLVNNDYNSHAMVGYLLENTLTENGSVARGVCKVDENGNLTEVVEHTRIEKRENGAESLLDGGGTVFLPNGTIVSMNFWGFGISMIKELEESFARFLCEEVPSNPLKAECLLPTAVNSLLRKRQADVSVLTTEDAWFGVTYADDMPKVQLAFAELCKRGAYDWGTAYDTKAGL